MAITTTATLTDKRLTRRAMYCTIQDVVANIQDVSIDFETANALHGDNRGYSIWAIDMIYVEYTATSDAGSRILQVEVQDSASTPDTFGKVFCQVPIVASDVAHVTFAPGLAQMQAADAAPSVGVGVQVATPDIVLVQAPLPANLVVLPLQVLRIVEIEGIEATDDMEVYITGRFLRA